MGRAWRTIWRAAALLLGIRLWLHSHNPAAAIAPPAPDPTDLGDETIAYLGEVAADSFRRQLELDESIWRSLSFLAALFAFIAALIGRCAADLPRFDGSMLAIVASGLLLGASLSMAWVLRWFFTVLRPRRFEYPAPDAEVCDYARDLVATYSLDGLRDEALDKRVARDIRMLLIDQHGAGASTNLTHNAERLKARSKVLLFMLLGFVLAFVSETTMFVHGRLYDAPQAREDDIDRQGISGLDGGTAGRRPRSADAAENAARHGGGPFLGAEFQGDDREGMKMGKPPANPPPARKPAVTPRPRPTSPKMQEIIKVEVPYVPPHDRD